MIKLSKSVRRTLERVDKTIEKDIENGIIYPSTVAINGIVHVGPDATEVQSKIFKKFRQSLEDGTNILMQYKDGEKAMLDIIEVIWDFYEPFTKTQILNIENDAYIEADLIRRLEKFQQINKNDKEAKALMNFFNNPCASAWGQEDLWCGVRKFKLVKSLEEYNNILRKKGIQDITTNTNAIEECNIRVAFSYMSEDEAMIQKGFHWDYNKRFKCKYSGEESALRKYKIWNDIRSVGEYYIYIPDVS